MPTTTNFTKPFILKNIRPINKALEANSFSSWYFGFDDDKEVFFLSIFDEHNPQEELIFTVSQNPLAISSAYRYKKVKRSPIKEEHGKYQEAQQVLDFIGNYLSAK